MGGGNENDSHSHEGGGGKSCVRIILFEGTLLFFYSENEKGYKTTLAIALERL